MIKNKPYVLKMRKHWNKQTTQLYNVATCKQDA